MLNIDNKFEIGQEVYVMKDLLDDYKKEQKKNVLLVMEMDILLLMKIGFLVYHVMVLVYYMGRRKYINLLEKM